MISSTGRPDRGPRCAARPRSACMSTTCAARIIDERLTCAFASSSDAVMVGWPDASQDRLPASSPDTRPRCPDIPQDLAKDAELLVLRHGLKHPGCHRRPEHSLGSSTEKSNEGRPLAARVRGRSLGPHVTAPYVHRRFPTHKTYVRLSHAPGALEFYSERLPVMAGRESGFLPSPRSRTVCALGTGKLIIRQREVLRCQRPLSAPGGQHSHCA